MKTKANFTPPLASKCKKAPMQNYKLQDIEVYIEKCYDNDGNFSPPRNATEELFIRFQFRLNELIPAEVRKPNSKELAQHDSLKQKVYDAKMAMGGTLAPKRRRL